MSTVSIGRRYPKIEDALFVQNTASTTGRQVLLHVYAFVSIADPLTECDGQYEFGNRADRHGLWAEVPRELGWGENDLVRVAALQSAADEYLGYADARLVELTRGRGRGRCGTGGDYGGGIAGVEGPGVRVGGDGGGGAKRGAEQAGEGEGECEEAHVGLVEDGRE